MFLYSPAILTASFSPSNITDPVIHFNIIIHALLSYVAHWHKFPRPLVSKDCGQCHCRVSSRNFFKGREGDKSDVFDVRGKGTITFGVTQVFSQSSLMYAPQEMF